MSHQRGLTNEEILRILENSDIESESDLSDSDGYIVPETTDDEDSETEEELPSVDVSSSQFSPQQSQQSTDSTVKMVARDGTEWNVANTPSPGRRTALNVLKEKGGPTAYACHRVDDSVISAFRLLFDESMLRIIKKHTESNAQNETKNSSWTVSLEELEAMIAIMYARGVFCAKGVSLNELWSRSWGPNFIRDKMTRDRFRELIRFLRFDEKSSRAQRIPADKFALISEIWNKFVENCLRCYRPCENITVDEQLLPSKARCKFTQFMPNKPDKYGLKFWIAADVESKYICNAFPYLGKEEGRPDNQPLGEYVVLRLMGPFLNQGRNVTTDNFFTSLELAKKLEQKKTSLVGTMNKIRREIPNCLKKNSSDLHSTTILKKTDKPECTLTVYQGKKNKNVIILSTLHPEVAVSKEGKKKPETVTFYNATKYGVDIVDQMIRKYSTKVACRRWPMHVFYNILDMAAINAWIIYNQVTKNNLKRKAFILQLVNELTNGKQQKAAQQRESQSNEEAGVGPDKSRKRKKCQVGMCKGNKTNDICEICKKAVCGKCVRKVPTVCSKCGFNV